MLKIITYLAGLCLLLTPVASICPLNEMAVCFNQDTFDLAFWKASVIYNVTEDLLLSSLNVSGVLVEKSSPIFAHFEKKNISQFAIDQNRFTTIAIMAIQSLKSDWNLTKSQLRKCMKFISPGPACSPLKIDCNVETTSYYRYDGQCNNKVNPHFGALMTPMVRLLEDGYEDGYESVSSTRGNESSRSDSIDANTARGINDNLQTETPSEMSTMAFQILTHEFMMTRKTQLTNDSHGGGFNCCNNNNDSLIDNLIKNNKYCMPIDLKSNDTCYANKTRCLNYVRSFRAFDQCNIAAAPSLVNFHTPYLDCELIYNEQTLKHLEENNGTFNFENNTKLIEILVGFDQRSSQLPGLLLYLSLYIRFHNIIFNELIKLKPAMNTTSAAFEARRITCALYQKIVIDQIQSVIDYKAPSSKCYNSSINPQVSVEFNIALRVMHYFIRDKMGIYDPNNFLTPSGIRGKLPLFHDQMVLLDNTTEYKSNKCGLTHGLLDTSWNMGGLGGQTHCSVFAKSNNETGADLRSWDFQLGREIGEPSYASFLQSFQNVNITCDRDIPTVNYSRFDNASMKFLLKRYQNTLWEMGLSTALDFEIRDHALGSATEFFISDQINRAICGDRFWFNHANGIFSQIQRDKINAFDLTQLLCLVNSCNATRIQTFPFLSPGSSNRKFPCLSQADILRGFDLKNW